MSIFKNIKVLCAERNTTIAALEKHLGFPRGSVYKWDEHSPSIMKVFQVAKYLDVSIDELVKEKAGE